MATRKRKTQSGLTPAKDRLLRSLKASRGQNLSMMAGSYLSGIRLTYLRGTDDQFEETSLALYDPYHVNRIKFSVAFKLFNKLDGFFEYVKQGLIDPSVKDVNERLREYEDAVNHLVRLRKLLHFCPHAVRFFPKLERTKQIISKYEVNDLPEKVRLQDRIDFLKRQEKRRLRSNRFLRENIDPAELRSRKLRDGKDIRAEIKQLSEAASAAA